MENPTDLSLEQQFTFRQIKDSIQNYSKEQLQVLAVNLARQNLVYQNQAKIAGTVKLGINSIPLVERIDLWIAEVKGVYPMVYKPKTVDDELAISMLEALKESLGNPRDHFFWNATMVEWKVLRDPENGEG